MTNSIFDDLPELSDAELTELFIQKLNILNDIRISNMKSTASPDLYQIYEDIELLKNKVKL